MTLALLALDGAPPPAETTGPLPCGAPPGDGATEAPLPTLTRDSTTLRTRSGEVTLPKSASIAVIDLTAARSGEPSQPCVRHGDQRGLLPRADVLLLPAQASALHKHQEIIGSTVIVLAREADELCFSHQSWFDPLPTTGKVGPNRLLYPPVEPALLLGDLSLDRWAPRSGAMTAETGELAQPADERGLTLPTKATLRWEEGGLWVEATLGQAAQVGDALTFTQGCDVLLRPKTGGEECLALTRGALGETGGGVEGQR